VGGIKLHTSYEISLAGEIMNRANVQFGFLAGAKMASVAIRGGRERVTSLAKDDIIRGILNVVLLAVNVEALSMSQAVTL